MIKVVKGDVLAIDRGIIVHGCNCQGVMGSGVAAEVAKRFPEAFTAYKWQEEIDGLTLGNISFAYTSTKDKIIVNALTQNLYGAKNASYSNGRLTSYDAVAECFYKVLELCKKNNCFDVAFPLIGAVRGGGDWSVISAIIDSVLPDTITKTLYLFEP
jgi:O-acetyl-ADP-ribose deacetylase (regulator of RNase III)